MVNASQASPDCKNPPIWVSGFVAATGKGHSLIEKIARGEDQILISHVANAFIRVKAVFCVIPVGERVGIFDKKYIAKPDNTFVAIPKRFHPVLE